MSANLMESNDILEKLRNALGADHVLCDAADREFFAMDVYIGRSMKYDY